MYEIYTWYSISFSACSLSSVLDSLKNLFVIMNLINEFHLAKHSSRIREKNWGCSKKLLGKSLESDIVSVKVGIHGMVHIRDIVFHTDTKNKVHIHECRQFSEFYLAIENIKEMNSYLSNKSKIKQA